MYIDFDDPWMTVTQYHRHMETLGDLVFWKIPELDKSGGLRLTRVYDGLFNWTRRHPVDVVWSITVAADLLFPTDPEKRAVCLLLCGMLETMVACMDY